MQYEELPVPGDDSWDQQSEPPTQPYDLWTRTNLGENFPDPITPLSATLWPTFFLLGRMPTKAERSADAPPLPKFQRFYGRVYVNEGVVIHSAVDHARQSHEVSVCDSGTRCRCLLLPRSSCKQVDRQARAGYCACPGALRCLHR